MRTDYSEEELRIAEIKIEKNVPRRPRYPHGAFATKAYQMEIGDSIFSEDDRVINGIMTSLNKMGRKIETRTEGNGRRLWRVS